jgi:hypothetical protein
MSDFNPIQKNVENFKFKYSLQRKNLNIHNQVFIKEFKFGLLSAVEKKKTILKLLRNLVLSSSVMLGILLNETYRKSKDLDIIATKFLVSHLKRRKMMAVSGKLGPKKSFIKMI